jgi:hypothetical protein
VLEEVEDEEVERAHEPAPEAGEQHEADDAWLHAQEEPVGHAGREASAHK